MRRRLLCSISCHRATIRCAWGLLLIAMARPCPGQSQGNAFDLIGRAPAEATLAVAVCRGGEHRRQLAELPIAGPGERLLRHFGTYNAYLELLRASDMPPAEAFDRLLGKELLFVSRTTDLRSDWSLYAESDEAVVREMLRALDGKPRQRREGVAIYSIEEGQFLVGRQGDRWLLSPATARDFFDRCLPLLRGELPEPALRQTEVFREARFVGRGDTAYLRIEDAQTISFTAGVVRHWQRYLEADLAIQSPELREDLQRIPRIETGLLADMEAESGLAVVEPLPDRTPYAYRILQEVLPEIDVDPGLRPWLGPRMLLKLGPGEAPALRLYWCLEVQSCARVEPAFDAMMGQTLAALALREESEPWPASGERREAEITWLVDNSLPVARQIFGEGEVVLGWQMLPETAAAASAGQDGPGWWVIGLPARGIESLRPILSLAETAASSESAESAASLSQGYLGGPEMARVVGRIRLPLFRSLAGVLEATETVRWKLERTSSDSVEATIRLKLQDEPADVSE